MFKFIVIPSCILFLIMFIGVQLDYRIHPEKALKELKMLGAKLISWFLFMILVFAVYHIPRELAYWRDDMGVAFNEKRREIGLPELDHTWRKTTSDIPPFWESYTPRNEGEFHYKKQIDYHFLEPLKETNFYKSPFDPNLTGWSIYNFKEENAVYMIRFLNPDGESGAGSEHYMVNETMFKLYFAP